MNALGPWLDDFLTRARLIYEGRNIREAMARSHKPQLRSQAFEALGPWAEAVAEAPKVEGVDCSTELEALRSASFMVGARVDAVLNRLRAAQHVVVKPLRERECLHVFLATTRAITGERRVAIVGSREVEEDFGVDRSTVRRWMEWAVDHGLICLRPGGGTAGQLFDITSVGIFKVEEDRDDILRSVGSTPVRKLKLSADGFRAIQEALLESFPQRADLERMLRLHAETNVELNRIADESHLSNVAFQVVRWFDRNGRLHDLLAAAQNDNPRNSRLREVVAELREAGVLEEPSP